MRLNLPETVQRCQRRSHYRIETAALSLPEVEIWPLLDPKSVLIAERANELAFEAGVKGSATQMSMARLEQHEEIMPEVGPAFRATLLNIGGGGVGLRVHPDDGSSLSRHKLFWLRISLPPELSTPICASAKLVHTHLESTQDFYAGLAFDFSFNPGHQRFVADQIALYIAKQQREMMRQEDGGTDD
jgi:c-di-GMP-binding flagellar brake protein YcgR